MSVDFTDFRRPICNQLREILKSKTTKPYTIKVPEERKGYVFEFSCDVCGTSFKKLSSLFQHRKMHKDNIFTKNYPKEYIETLNLQSDIYKKSICNSCDEIFHAPTYFSVHINICDSPPPPDKEKPVICEICLRIFTSESFLKEHMYVHVDEKPLKCRYCKATFNHRQNLSKHNKCHKGNSSSGGTEKIQHKHKTVSKDKTKTHVNSSNTSISSTSSSSGSSSSSSNSKKPYRCKIGTCKNQYENPLQLRRHITRRHIPVDKHVQCEFCEKKYPRKHEYFAPVAADSSNNSSETVPAAPSKCQVCGKNFSRPNHLKQHMLYHSEPEEKPAICKTCPKKRIKTHVAQAAHNNHLSAQVLDKSTECGLFYNKKMISAKIVQQYKRKHNSGL